MSKKIYTTEDTEQLRATLSQRIKSARKVLGITQAVTAKRIGISAEFFARVERGHAMPGLTTLVKIANELGVTVDFLFGADSAEKKAPPPMQQAAPAETPPKMAYIIRQARQSVDLRRFIIAFLKLCDR